MVVSFGLTTPGFCFHVLTVLSDSAVMPPVMFTTVAVAQGLLAPVMLSLVFSVDLPASLFAELVLEQFFKASPLGILLGARTFLFFRAEKG